MENDSGSYLETDYDLSEEEWMLLLWGLVTDFPENEWAEFTHELIYKNRFYISHRVVDIVEQSATKQIMTIDKGQLFYRARIYHQDPLREILPNFFKKHEQKTEGENFDFASMYYTQMAAVLTAIKSNSPLKKTIRDVYEKWERKKFKGFNKKDSGIAPADKATPGRVNPEKISYLYLSEDPETAVYEVRPIIGQHISVATFQAMSNLRLYDLTEIVEKQKDNMQDYDIALLNVIQKHFAEPNTGDVFNYLPTQYLSEIIKRKGFDGVRFRSSLNNNGINVALFDDKKCKAICSDIVRVGGIELQFINPDIYELGKLLNSGSKK